ncbi:class I SAM-dependent methyltransferase [Rhizobium sp. TRM95111]|uniref:class I SAM-dependent methyltransferase n=1 Tax=Rhizobium alarense TaxID=2846851 RepID=UPI001F2AF0DD|nr:class I SAM-dependent methyltransferase [Rhizobium alarense]MCF3640736.1 class I SAM-dependent methyltransferase [Rhizobium alarense]
MPTALARKIKTLIRTGGPISVTDYFALCLADPEHGYYRTRDPFGRAGDFVTAPEVSQLFGEMLGVFLVQAWQKHRGPHPVRIVEIGPGRGTMMADMLRVVARLAPDLLDAASVHLVETSPKLREVQRQTLGTFTERLSWHDGFDDIPPGFLLLAANELFDAIPIRQFVKTQAGFRERMVGLDAQDDLAFAAGVAGIDPALLPETHVNAPVGTIFEIAPAREAVMQTICERLAHQGGTALVVDYGHFVTGFGDTLQAVLKHDFDPPLAHPGEADLTSHVDFARLALTAADCGVHVHGILHQGDFLMGLGLADRAAALGRNRDADMQAQIVADVQRLAGSGAGRMGDLFKVMAVSSEAIALAPFRNGD